MSNVNTTVVSAHVGQKIYQWMTDLFPLCRSITGQGVRDSLAYLSQQVPGITVRAVPSGTQVFDWEVPQEWRITEAYIETQSGQRIVDFKRCNLHVLGYSTAIDEVLSLAQLQPHLYSLPEQPDAIPYVTSYYARNWGFCLTHQQRLSLQDDEYRVRIDSEHFAGELNYGELIIPGKSEQEIFLSSYLCHPSMANNELSGPLVMAAIAQWLAEAPRLYSYRLFWGVETIGSLTYLSLHLPELKRHVVAGFNLTCIGDDNSYSMLHSRLGNTLADKVAAYVLDHEFPAARKYSFLQRGSDERQYCAPGVDLPLVTLMRTKFAEYPEYHTSLDNLDFVSPQGLQGGFEFVKRCIEVVEANQRCKVTVLGEPQLGKRGLYPTTSQKGVGKQVRNLRNIIAYSDGEHDSIDIALRLEIPFQLVVDTQATLLQAGLLEKVS
ncbi:DUF4910 domain-containing protein [Rheinheimera maricola]|uniref:DUF4910 domain-containing protein n=1 Tax=Rheinheimera maricola TaxID=2793282 RepID=A0ABS7X6G9_9GAMM|nr:DUF4910 domain-containing protein [Rheinheimera maricola]MBZ9610217.1 DUF4910 domain-containing protein [Rheinheimera maricola]